jgi:hypothetical protein
VVNTRANLPELTLAAAEGTPPVQWRVSDAPVAYNAALKAMNERVDAIVAVLNKLIDQRKTMNERIAAHLDK